MIRQLATDAKSEHELREAGAATSQRRSIESKMFRTTEAFGCTQWLDSESPSLFDITVSTRKWTNRLVWSENGDFLAALSDGYLRSEIEAAGGIKLVYIDPPFDAGRDFNVNVKIPGQALASQASSVVEEFAFRDIWLGGTDHYVELLRERLIAIRDIMASDGAVYVHCDWRLDYLLRAALDDVFGRECFRNVITWKRDAPGKGAKRTSGQWPRNADSILYYTKSANDWFFEQQYVSLTPEQQKAYRYVDEAGRRYKAVQLGDYSEASINRFDREGLIHRSSSGERYKKYFLDEAKATVDSIWSDILGFGTRTASREMTGYATQKPEALLERIIKASTRPGELVADFYCGSGTTLAVAQRLGRTWLGVDVGKRAIQIARKRLFSGTVNESPRFDVMVATQHRTPAFVDFTARILDLYGGELMDGGQLIQGVRKGRLVAVNAQAPIVTREYVDTIVEAVLSMPNKQVDILGFDYEIGLLPDAIERSTSRGVDLCFRFIPQDAIGTKKRGPIPERFRTAPSFSLHVHRGGKREVQVELVGYEPGDEQNVSSLSLVDNWSVDYRYGTCRNHLDASIFHPIWVSARTRTSVLALTSPSYVYAEPGCHRIAVRVVDVFGNDAFIIRELMV